MNKSSRSRVPSFSWSQVLANRNPFHQLHHKEGPAVLGGSGIQHLGDVRMIHQRQRLPLRLEPRHHLPGIHPQFDDLEGHPALDRLPLLRHIHDPEPAFADLLQEFVATEWCLPAAPRGCAPRAKSWLEQAAPQALGSSPLRLPVRRGTLRPRRWLPAVLRPAGAARRLRHRPRQGRKPAPRPAACGRR